MPGGLSTSQLVDRSASLSMYCIHVQSLTGLAAWSVAESMATTDIVQGLISLSPGKDSLTNVTPSLSALYFFTFSLLVWINLLLALLHLHLITFSSVKPTPSILRSWSFYIISISHIRIHAYSSINPVRSSLSVLQQRYHALVLSSPSFTGMPTRSVIHIHHGTRFPTQCPDFAALLSFLYSCGIPSPGWFDDQGHHGWT